MFLIYSRKNEGTEEDKVFSEVGEVTMLSDGRSGRAVEPRQLGRVAVMTSPGKAMG